MKEITVQTFNSGRKVDESKLVISNKETLIVNVPATTTLKQSKHLHDTISDALKGGHNPIIIPEWVTLLVLKVSE